MEEQKQQHVEIDLSREVAEGIYSNLAVISHSASEFIVDFARLMPGVPKPQVMSRIIVYETQIGGHRKRTSSRLDIITDTIGSIVIQMKRRYGEITYRNAYAFLYVAAAGRQFDTLPDTTVIACKHFRS